MAVRLDTLAVQDGGGGVIPSPVLSAHADSEGIVQSRPSLVQAPGSKHMVHSFPGWIVLRQLAPRNASFENIEDGIHDKPPVRLRSAAAFGFGEHRLEELPLLIG